MTWTKKKLAAIAGVLVVAAGAALLAKIGPRNVIGMLLYDQRTPGVLNAGDPAPDVELLALDGSRREKLSSQIGDRPLVLIFGSFT